MSYDIDKVEAPRLVDLTRGESGYGFNLHGDKNHPGQTISAVDKDSPAELGGLREGDKLIEVNGVNVEEKPHGDVVKLIKEHQNTTTLLVCDKDTLAYLKENHRQCTADMANLVTVVQKPVEPAQVISNGNATLETTENLSDQTASVEEINTPPPEQVTKDEDDAAVAADTTPDEVKQLNSVLDEQETSPQPEEPAIPKEQTDSKPQTAEEPVKSANNDGLVFDMTAARPSGSKRKSAKSSGEKWSDKVGMINSL